MQAFCLLIISHHISRDGVEEQKVLHGVSKMPFSQAEITILVLYSAVILGDEVVVNFSVTVLSS